MYMRILSISWTFRATIEEVLKRTKIQPQLINVIKIRRNIVLRIYYAKVEDKRDIGRKKNVG